MLLIQLTGLSGAGKTTISKLAQTALEGQGLRVAVLDGDEFRQHLCKDLGFSRADRIENIRRIGIVGSLLASHGIIAIMAAINPYEEARQLVRALGVNVRTVFVDCPVGVAEQRDVRGLYRRAHLPEDDPGHLKHFTGVSDPFEIPSNPDLVIHTASESPERSSQQLVDFVVRTVRNL